MEGGIRMVRREVRRRREGGKGREGGAEGGVRSREERDSRGSG